jgi:hypothetical protein
VRALRLVSRIILLMVRLVLLVLSLQLLLLLLLHLLKLLLCSQRRRKPTLRALRPSIEHCRVTCRIRVHIELAHDVLRILAPLLLLARIRLKLLCIRTALAHRGPPQCAGDRRVRGPEHVCAERLERLRSLAIRSV